MDRGIHVRSQASGRSTSYGLGFSMRAGAAPAMSLPPENDGD